MSKIYISRTNRSTPEAFEGLRNTLQMYIGCKNVVYYQQGHMSTVDVTGCDYLIVIPTYNGLCKGYIGKGVYQQIEAAQKSQVKVYIYDHDGDYLVPFLSVKRTQFNSDDWNRVMELDWECTTEQSVYAFLKKHLAKYTYEGKAKAVGILDTFDFDPDLVGTVKDTAVNSLILKLR